MADLILEGLSAIETVQAARLLSELASRQREALRLYEPEPEQDAFHRSIKRERIVRGGNRAGKTLCTCVEVARAVTGQDPYHKYPLRDGRAMVVGKKLKEVSQVLFRKLVRPGAFRIIRDPKTKEWRTFKPWQAWDAAHWSQSRPAPPLIPERFIEGIAWYNKKENQPSLLKIKPTGWEITFCSSEGKPLTGVDLDLVLFDEEILESTWHEEASARLLDRRGRFIWGATPQLGTEQLYRIHERWLQGDPDIDEFQLRSHTNPYLPPDEVEKFRRKISDQAAYVRIEGEYALDLYRVFPEFSERTHVLGENDLRPNEDWTRYLVVDPGTQVCGVLFCAVPPDESCCLAYDELYIKRASASVFGEQVAAKATGYNFEAFLIDARSARVQEIGSGRTIADQYSEALHQHKIRSNRTGYNFLWASTDVPGAIEALRRWLQLDSTGKPYFRIAPQCVNLIDEIKRYRYRTDTMGNPTDKPFDRHDHLVFGARSIAAFKPRWVKPRPVEKPIRGAYAAYLRLNKMKRGKPLVRLGPPPLGDES